MFESMILLETIANLLFGLLFLPAKPTKAWLSSEVATKQVIDYEIQNFTETFIPSELKLTFTISSAFGQPLLTKVRTNMVPRSPPQLHYLSALDRFVLFDSGSGLHAQNSVLTNASLGLSATDKD